MIRSMVVSFVFICAAALSAVAEITVEQVAGKTLASDGATFVIGADGSLSGTVGKGDKVVGTWAVQDGQWCRTIISPERLVGSACQAATIKNRTLTVTRDDGSKVSFKIQ